VALAWFALSFLAAVGLTASEGERSAPRLTDPRLEIRLFATEPDIVTPIGLAIDARNRLFVVESHTHLPPRDYAGPRHDRIKLFTDADRDGTPEHVGIFAESLQAAMNLALSAEGELFVCCAHSVERLRDANDDGVADTRATILQLDTAETYPHNSLLGITLSHDGWLYVSRGNTGGHEYTLRAADGSVLHGYGDGGNIVRCRPDGGQLQLVATGFWNPFDLKFDFAGRLLCLDNDPDSRGPNRLLHIIPGGDYGFKALYGQSGRHPYQGWEGELPGTLPMIAAVGESPGGLLDCTRAALPEEYRGSVLVTVWGEHTVQRVRLQAAGASLRGEREVLVEGGEFFRPVAIEAAADGAIYITDWVLKDYPNHGRGAIWKLSTQAGSKTLSPRKPFAAPRLDPASRKLNRLREVNSLGRYPELRAALTNADAFVRSTALTALTKPIFRSRLLHDLAHADGAVRLGALLVLRRVQHPSPAPLVERLLADADEQVRRMALIWCGELELPGMTNALQRTVSTEPVSPVLFETYLATMEILAAAARGPKPRQPGFAIKHDVDQRLVEATAHDDSKAPVLRALALARLADLDCERNFQLLKRLAHGTNSLLQREAILSLDFCTHPGTAEVLKSVALDRKAPAELRADAVAALARQPIEELPGLVEFLNHPEPAVQLEAARGLRAVARQSDVREALARTLAQVRESPAHARLAVELRSTLGAVGAEPESPGAEPARPTSLAEWQSRLAEGGDPVIGRRFFFAPHTACITCHRVQGRGGLTGPDLSSIGRTLSRAQLVQSIVAPSADIAPAYQAWIVETTDEESYTGLQGPLRSGGAVTLILNDGREITIPGSKVAFFGASNSSLMPDGLENAMTVEDFRDLLAYLESLR
jgi:hypothetical protein